MKPILFHLFGVGIASYAAFMLLGYALAFGLIWLLNRRDGFDGRGALPFSEVLDLYLVMSFASLFGAKVGHVVFEASSHRDAAGVAIHRTIDLLRADPWHWLRFTEPGYVFFGGLVVALAVAAMYFRRRQDLNSWRYADLFAPGIMLGAGVGRIGCFLAGCCYGKATEVPWAVHFGHGLVHPTQLYDAGVGLGLAGALAWQFPRRGFDGQIIALMLTFYAPLRAITELFRGDPDRGALWGISTSQWIALPVGLVGLLVYCVRRRHAQKRVGSEHVGA
jgi:phosphatidylglycerol---prolipoprotein diacylglyceryl transferase